MGAQELFNVFVGIVGAAGGWWLNTVWKAVSDLQRQDRELAEKLSKVEVLVAGDYVRKDEFHQRVDAMENRLVRKLDMIDSKLDGKVDK
jgi:hypothetical protein